MKSRSENQGIVVITGAESTGKTQLAQQLAIHYKSPWIPEYARQYIGSLTRPYNYEDVEKIALEQAAAYSLAKTDKAGFVFFDTWLIITKVWFEVVFGREPDWLDPFLSGAIIDLFLVCDTDLEWGPDPLRENGGEMRNILQAKYIENLHHYGFAFAVVSGAGQDRLMNAVDVVDRFFDSVK